MDLFFNEQKDIFILEVIARKALLSVIFRQASGYFGLEE